MQDTLRSATVVESQNTTCKKLIEVSLPLHDLNVMAKREKTITQNHPSIFHLWWGHRPFALSRALIFASLVDDPAGRPDLYPTLDDQLAARTKLMNITSRLGAWANTGDERLLQEAELEILRSKRGESPVIVDPFAGRGTIPIEAQRLGCSVLASDINPVAALITRAQIQIPARFAKQPPISKRSAFAMDADIGPPAMAIDLEYYGHKLAERARERLAEYYPQVASRSGAQRQDMLGWLWARTVTCSNPICRGTVPLVRSTILSTKRGGRFLFPVIDIANRRVSYAIKTGTSKSMGTILPKKGAECPFCNVVLSFDEIKTIVAKEGFGNQLLCGVAQAKIGKTFISSSDAQATVVEPPFDAEALNVPLARNSQYMGPTLYNLLLHRDLYTRRQLFALSTMTKIIGELYHEIAEDAAAVGVDTDSTPLNDGGKGSSAYAEAICIYLALCLSRLTDRCSTLTFWQPDETLGHVFRGPNFQMTWDYVESNPISDETGSFMSTLTGLTSTLRRAVSSPEAVVENLDCRELAYPDHAMIVTDPPYYDNIPYADLSDYFYVWLKRALDQVSPDLFSSLTTPKLNELTYNPARFAGSEDEARRAVASGLEETFLLWRTKASVQYPTVIFYAFRAKAAVESEETGQQVSASFGWEAILSSLVRAGYQVTATWPLGTEREGRFRAQKSNALASSIVLVCRPRFSDKNCSRAQFLAELRSSLPLAVERLKEINLAATDLEQAALGAGMAVFSQFQSVLEVDDSPMTVRSALALINDELMQIVLGEVSDVDPETQFALSWFDSYGYEAATYGKADTLLRLKGASQAVLRTSGVVQMDGGLVKLMSPASLTLPEIPSAIQTYPAWAKTQYLISALLAEEGGEELAASFMHLLDATDHDIVKSIAYHCYLVCIDKKRTVEARDFSSLISAWPDIERLARDVQPHQETFE